MGEYKEVEKFIKNINKIGKQSKLHSAYGFDGIAPDGSLYGEEEGLEYVLNKLAEREILLENNGDVYVIYDDTAYFNDKEGNQDILHCERELTGVGMNFIFYNA